MTGAEADAELLGVCRELGAELVPGLRMGAVARTQASLLGPCFHPLSWLSCRNSEARAIFLLRCTRMGPRAPGPPRPGGGAVRVVQLLRSLGGGWGDGPLVQLPPRQRAENRVPGGPFAVLTQPERGAVASLGLGTQGAPGSGEGCSQGPRVGGGQVQAPLPRAFLPLWKPQTCVDCSLSSWRGGSCL